MTKADDKKIAALAKKNAAKQVQKERTKQRHRYDDTLPDDTEEDQDARDFFREMKKREF